jgi:surface antigen
MRQFLVSILAATAVFLSVAVTPAVAQPYGPYGDPYDDGYGPPPPPPGYYDRGDYGPPQGYRYRGCSRDRTAATIIGGILGGIIGNNIGRGRDRGPATVAGIIFGGIAGNAISRSACRDRHADAYYYNRAYYDAFEEPYYGRRYDWRNPYSGNYGYVTPIRDYDDGYRYGYRGGECREFSQTVWIGRHRTQAYGTACRARDGSWRIVNY